MSLRPLQRMPSLRRRFVAAALWAGVIVGFLFPLPAAASDPNENWSGDFGAQTPGFWGMQGGLVYDLTVHGGDVYVGGRISVAGLTPVEGVAKWYGGGYVPVGSEFTPVNTDLRVISLASDGVDLYAGGHFGLNGSASISLVRWDGAAWSPVGGGVNDWVRRMVVDGGVVYVAGIFDSVGTPGARMPSAQVAAWDGVAWQSMGAGIAADDDVYALYVDGSDIYIGGDISGGIMRWNGSTWQAVGPGVNLVVGAIDTWQGQLLVGGGQIGNTATDVRVWDGVAWNLVGTSFTSSSDFPAVHDFIEFQGDLYAAGRFFGAGPPAIEHVARFDGSTWHPLGTGLTNSSWAFAIVDNQLWVGGEFLVAGGEAARQVGVWDGSQWVHETPTDYGMDGAVEALETLGDDIVAAGSFETAGAVTHNRIARFAGAGWHALGSGTDGPVYSLASLGDTIYAGGAFTAAGGISAMNLANWDGSGWLPAGDPDGAVYALRRVGDTVYAAGAFTTIGGVGASRVARRSGAGWTTLGTGTAGTVRALEWWNGNLYAAGFFVSAGAVTVNRVARFDGATWSDLAGGVDGPAYAMAVWHGDLYLGGQFINAGGVPTHGIARWDGSTWFAVGAGGIDAGFSNGVFALRPAADELLVGGEFSAIGGVPANNLARFGGSTYLPFGRGTNDRVKAIAANSTGLFVGGDFTEAGFTWANFMGCWDEVVATAITDDGCQPPRDAVRLLASFPNPFNPTTTIRYQLNEDAAVRLDVYDARGRHVRTLVDRHQSASRHPYTVTWDGRNGVGEPVASGVYFYRIEVGRQRVAAKMVLLK